MPVETSPDAGPSSAKSKSPSVLGCVRPEVIHALESLCLKEGHQLTGITDLESLAKLTGTFDIALMDVDQSGGSPFSVSDLKFLNGENRQCARWIMLDGLEESWGYQRAFIFRCTAYARLDLNTEGTLTANGISLLSKVMQTGLSLPPYVPKNYYDYLTNDMLHPIVESSQSAMMVILADHTVYFANLAAQALFRRPTQLLMGMPVEELFADSHQKPVFDNLVQSISRKLGGSTEIRLKNWSGEEFDALVTLYRIFDEQYLEGTMGMTLTVITERKRAEQALLERENRLRSLFDGIEDVLFVHNEEGRILDCNSAACRRLGYSREELLSMNTSEIDAPGFADGYRLRLRQQLSHGRHHCEGIHQTKDGQTIPVDINTSVIDYEGNTAILAVCRDITERKKADEEKRKLELQVQHAQKLESLGVLAGGIAHDFNNLLMGILGHASLALAELPPESPATESLRKIELSGMRAAELTKQMLAYSGKGRFVIEPLDLNALVEEMGHLLEVSISKNARLRFDLDRRIPRVEVDSTQIRQVVMNLITNASDSMGDEGGIITVSTGSLQCDHAYLADTYLNEELKEGPYVFFEVSDTGCGMDLATRERIFEPFFTTKFAGRGLGLAAVLGIVRGHSGAMKVYSEKGRGSTFKVLLPACNENTEAESESQEEVSANRGEGRTVLVIDDEETVRTVARQMLEKLNYRVYTASDGRAGIDIYRRDPAGFDLVILDMTMPNMGGEEVFRELRRINKGARVVLTSGYNEREATHRLNGKGLAGFIQKPYRIQEISKVVREGLA